MKADVYGCVIKLQAIYLTQCLKCVLLYPGFPARPASLFMRAIGDLQSLPRWSGHPTCHEFPPQPMTQGPGLTLTTSAWNERKVLPSWAVAMIGLDDPWKVQGRFRFLEWKILKTGAECWLPNLFPLLELEGMKTKHRQPKSKIDIQISKPWSSVNVRTNLRGSNCRVIHPDFCQSVAPSEDLHLQFLPWLLGWEGNSIADRTCKPSRSVALHCHLQIRGIPLGKWWHKWNHQCKKNSLSESCWGIACLAAPQM